MDQDRLILRLDGRNLMKRLMTVVALSAGLAACGGERSGTIETGDGDTAEYSIDQDGTETTTTVETADGKMTIQTGEGGDVALPEGFTVYPGAKVTSNMSVDGGDGKGTMITMQSDASPEDMVAHYRKQAVAAGYKISMEMNNDSNRIIAGETSSGEGGFTFSAGPSGDGTAAQLMIGDSFR